eukprot:1681645-Prymnesium_polylepis.2
MRRAAHVGLNAELDDRLGLAHQLDRRVGREGGDSRSDLLTRRRSRRSGHSSSSGRRSRRGPSRRRRNEGSRRRRHGRGGGLGRAHA